ncbi:MAG: N-acetylmuramoyl-L-alanine amidase [Verrucomicrobiota bacterium]
MRWISLLGLSLITFAIAATSPDRDPWSLIKPQAWKTLDLYQKTMTREQFETSLHDVFDPYHGFPPFTQWNQNTLSIFEDPAHKVPAYTLEFAPSLNEVKPHPRLWRTPQEFSNKKAPGAPPLQGLKIAIDPGHIGGKWGPLQNRSVVYPGLGRLQEGDMNIITAKILRQNLEKLGADVFLTRENTEPVTTLAIDDFKEPARLRIYKKYPDLEKKYSHLLLNDQYARLGEKLEFVTQFLFFRIGEIRSRAHKMRTLFQPDITVVLYINATPSSGHGNTVGVNQNILFIHGCYTQEEAADPEQQVRMLYKVLDRGTGTEQYVAERIANAFQRITGLPPVPYGDSKTSRQLSNNKYVVARNLAANREYDGPVVTTEPFFMNNKYVVRRLLAGDYEGTRTFLDKSFTSIFREYAQAVTDGLVDAYSNKTP